MDEESLNGSSKIRKHEGLNAYNAKNAKDLSQHKNE
jgi:hypothetical protein